MYFILTGVEPPSAIDIGFETVQLVPPRVLNPRLSARTEKVILKAMQIRPDQRYQTIDALRKELTGA